MIKPIDFKRVTMGYVVYKDDRDRIIIEDHFIQSVKKSRVTLFNIELPLFYSFRRGTFAVPNALCRRYRGEYMYLFASEEEADAFVDEVNKKQAERESNYERY